MPRVRYSSRSETPIHMNEDRLRRITVCVCTYKRPDLLLRCLKVLDDLNTDGLFTYSVVVVDNDEMRSAESAVREHATVARVPIKYCVEPRQNIALARNQAIENASGDFVALIDDDEFPTRNWLTVLFKICQEYGAAGVLGPVVRYFDETPPAWLEKSSLYTRPINPTGSVVRWEGSRTGNALLRKDIFTPGEPPFRPEFRAGEDQDFFRRMIEAGHKFIWSAEAVVYEVVPPNRWKRRYMIRKALLRGATASMQPNCGPLSIVKSLMAVVAYSLSLPFICLFGHHRFMTVLIKLCDHLGKLFAVLGLNPVKEEYVAG